MKKVMLIYGYADSRNNQAMFEFSVKRHKEIFGDHGFDIILHCWQDDPLRDDYIKILEPKHTIIDRQENVPLGLMIREQPNVGPRVNALIRLHNVLQNCSYDLCFLRRFDLVFKQPFDFDNIDLECANIVQSHVFIKGISEDTWGPLKCPIPRAKWIVKTNEHSSSFGERRVSDFILITNQHNMLRFLDFDIQTLKSYMTLKTLKQYGILKTDFHYIFGQRLNDLNLFDKIHYVIKDPHDIEITRRYFHRIGAIDNKKCRVIDDAVIREFSEKPIELFVIK
jgi:hypothetical protein